MKRSWTTYSVSLLTAPTSQRNHNKLPQVRRKLATSKVIYRLFKEGLKLAKKIEANNIPYYDIT